MIEFDHRIPIPSSDLLATVSFANQLKGDLTEDEFREAISQLSGHWKGAPFDKAAIAFQYWSRVAVHPKGPGNFDRPAKGAPLPTECVVCGRKPHKGSKYCPRCRQWTKWASDATERRLALVEAYDKRKHGFICHYTGIELDDKDPTSPWYVSFDHGIPRKKGAMVVAAQWITIMKEDLSRDEFYKVMNEQERVFRTGKAFDKGVCTFEYWRRKKAAKRLWTAGKARRKAVV